MGIDGVDGDKGLGDTVYRIWMRMTVIYVRVDNE